MIVAPREETESNQHGGGDVWLPPRAAVLAVWVVILTSSPLFVFVSA